MPPNELQRKLRALRGHLRRLIVLAGASRVVLVVLGALAAALVLDWAARLDTPGRLVVLIAAAVASGFALWRCLISPLRVPLGSEELSLLVERRFPGLRDRLISTVQFARVPSVAPLSDDMVSQLRSDAVAQTASLDFAEVASARASARWALAAGGVLVAACAYALLFPAATAIFACRFLDPFSAIEWPRRTQLTLLAYDKDGHQLAIEGTRIHVPKGEDLNLLVRAARFSGNIWRPPRRVAVQYRFAAGGKGTRSVPMGDTATYSTCFATVTEPFSFQAAGDDAETRTYEVQVRNRPRIESIRIAIRAPAYTCEPERMQTDGRGAITAIAGSLASLEITANKPVAAGGAQLLVDGQPPAPLAFAGAETPDPTRLQGSFALRLGQKQYAISLLDTDGLTNSPAATFRLDVRADREPAVKLPEPGASKKVTAKAVVPIRLIAEDDYRVVRTRFLYLRDEKGKPVVHAFPEPREPAKKVEDALEWDITTLALKERDVIQVYAEAEDAYTEVRDGKTLGPNVGRSATYQLTVISDAEMASLLQRRQQEVKEKLKKLIGRQETAKEGVEHLRQADKPDRRDLTLAEREERKIAAAAETIASELDDVLADLKHNKVGTPIDQQRAQELTQAVRQLAAADMPEAAKHIAKAAQAPELPEQREHLGNAATKQQQIADDLRAALAKFDQWHDVDELLRDASELLLAQKKLNESTAALARDLLGKPAEQLTPAEKGTARSLARTQQGARDSMQALETKMAAVAEKVREKDPAAAKLVDQAISQASADQIRRRMDDAGSRIEQARPASALPLQAEAIKSLEKLIETLSRARSPYLAQDLRRLQEEIRQRMEAVDRLLKEQQRELTETQVANLRRQLTKLQEQQATTQGATKQAGSDAAGLKKQAAPQAEHAKEAEEMGRQLQRLTEMSKDHKDPLDKAQEAMKSAAGSMSQASQSLDQGQKADAASAQDKALEQLQKAESQLAGLQKELAKEKSEAERLAERAKEQEKTAKGASEESKTLEKTAANAEKTLPTTAKSIEQASRHADDASKAMDKAKQQLEKASSQPDSGAAEQGKAQQDQQEAKDQLEKTLEQLAKAHDQLDLQRRAQELYELQKVLTEMLPRQVAVRESTQKLDADSEGGKKPLDHAQTLKTRELADEQGKLHEISGDIIQRLERESVPVFLYVMRDAVRLMAEVQKHLAEQKVDWLTQDSEREIERDIMQLLEALKSESQRLAQQEQQKAGGGGGGGKPKPRPLVAPYHQLKELKTLQLLVNKGTRGVEVDRATVAGPRERLLQRRAARLSEQQAELGKLSRDLGDVLEKGKEKESMGPP